MCGRSRRGSVVGVGVVVWEQAWLCRWCRHGSVLGVGVVSLCVCVCLSLGVAV